MTHYLNIAFIDYDKRTCLGIYQIRVNKLPTSNEEWSDTVYKFFPQYRPYSFAASEIDVESLTEFFD